jgi:hypothetical protein
VQRTYVYLVPRVLGCHATSLYDNTSLFDNAKKVSWQVMEDNLMAMFDW